MSIGSPKHEIYERRKGRNMAVLGLCVGMVVLVFSVTVVKVQNGGMIEGYDHTFRASVLPVTEDAQ